MRALIILSLCIFGILFFTKIDKAHSEDKLQIARVYQACETYFFDHKKIVSDTLTGIVGLSKTRNEIHAINFIEAQLGHIFAMFSISVHSMDMTHVQTYIERARSVRKDLLDISKRGLDVPFEEVSPNNHRALFNFYDDLGGIGKRMAQFRDRKKNREEEYKKFMATFELVKTKIALQVEAINRIMDHISEILPVLSDQLKTRRDNLEKVKRASELLKRIEDRVQELVDGIKERGVELTTTQKKNLEDIFIPAIRDTRKVVDDVVAQEEAHIEFIGNHAKMVRDMQNYVLTRHLKLSIIPSSILLEAHNVMDKINLARIHEMTTSVRRSMIAEKADELERASRKGALNSQQRLELEEIPGEIDALAEAADAFKESLGDPNEYAKRLTERVQESMAETDSMETIMDIYTRNANAMDLEATFNIPE